MMKKKYILPEIRIAQYGDGYICNDIGIDNSTLNDEDPWLTHEERDDDDMWDKSNVAPLGSTSVWDNAW